MKFWRIQERLDAPEVGEVDVGVVELGVLGDDWLEGVDEVEVEDPVVELGVEVFSSSLLNVD